MSNYFSVFFIIFLASQAYGFVTFEKTYGGLDNDCGNSARQTLDGGYIIAGTTKSYGTGYQNIYLIKTDSLGNTLWTQTYGNSGDNNYGYIAQQTFDRGYIIAGASNGNICLIKTNSHGDTLWTKNYGGNKNNYGNSVQQTQDSGYIILGATTYSGTKKPDIYLIKTNSRGNTLWTKTYGGVKNDYGYSIQQTQDTGYIIVGATNSFTMGKHYDVYLIKTNSSGNILWAKTYFGKKDDYGYSAQQTQDGGYIIAGATNSPSSGQRYDVYLIKTNSSGDSLWAKIYWGEKNDYGYSVQQTQDSGYVIAGATSSFGAGDFSVYLIKTNPSGDLLWTKTFGGTSADYGYSVRQTRDGGYIICGSTASFGAGENDVYLIKTDPYGNVEKQKE